MICRIWKNVRFSSSESDVYDDKFCPSDCTRCLTFAELTWFYPDGTPFGGDIDESE